MEDSKQVFVVRFEAMDYEEEYFDIPKTTEDIHVIGCKLRTAAEECGVKANADWYFLSDGKAIALNDLTSLGGQAGEIINSVTNEDGEAYLLFSCIENGGTEHWGSGFVELSRYEGLTDLRVFGNHSEHGPNVTQFYSCGEMDSGIERDGDPGSYTMTSEGLKYYQLSLEHLDVSFYDPTKSG